MFNSSVNLLSDFEPIHVHSHLVTNLETTADHVRCRKKITPRNTRQDLKLITRFLYDHRGELLIHVGLLCVVIAAVASGGLVVILSRDDLLDTNTYCSPGGDFVFGQSYNPWSSEHLFQITQGFGRLTFAEAKTIAVAWDVVVGRGGQFLLSALCFYVFSKSLNRILERPDGSISYDGFRAIVFDNPSLASASKLLRGMSSVTGWRVGASILWMILASVYVIAFPSMVSAMTGYSSNVIPYFTEGSTMVSPTDLFHRALYRIDGADRIAGLGLDSVYVVGSQGFQDQYLTPDQDYGECLNQVWSNEFGSGSGDCRLALGISDYISEYGTEPLANTSSRLRIRALHVNYEYYNVSPPTLDITVYNTYQPGFSGRLTNASGLANSSDMYTTTNGTEVYDATQLQALGQCLAETNYMWGFSFLLLFGFFVSTGIWTLGMYIMWLDAYWNCKLESAGRDMGFYRGIVDLNNAIWKNSLKEPGELMSNSRIKMALAAKDNGGRVTFDELQDYDLPLSRRERFRSFKRSVPLLTTPWTALYWTRLTSCLFGSFVSLLRLVISFFGYGPYRNRAWFNLRTSLSLFGLVLAITCWSMTSLMIFGAIARLYRPLRKVASKFDWIRPRTVASWTWAAVFGLIGLHGFFVSATMSYETGGWQTEWLERVVTFPTLIYSLVCNFVLAMVVLPGATFVVFFRFF